MSLTGVNWLAVAVGAIINMFVGFLWYGPLFGDRWMRMIGKRAEDIESDSTMYVVTGVAALVTSYMLAVVMGASGAATLVEGAIIGGAIWVGLGATATLVYTTFEGPPTNVWFLHAMYQLVVFVALGGLFTVWR